MCACLSARKVISHSGDTIVPFGSGEEHVGTLTSGLAPTVRYELDGSRIILERLGPQDISGEVFSFQNIQYRNMSVIRDKDYSVLSFDYDHILSPCPKACLCHQRPFQSTLQILSEEAILLGERVKMLSKRSVREKLVYYFFCLAKKAGSNQLTIPLAMVDLADYLSVDRSTIARELKKIRDSGLIIMEHRHVILLSPDAIISSLS